MSCVHIALPLHPTAETVLSDIHPIAENWKNFGEALEIPEHILDNISMEGSDPVRLHEIVHYYFNSTKFTHTWEEIVRALWKIEETEAADKIIRTRKLPSMYNVSCVHVHALNEVCDTL